MNMSLLPEEKKLLLFPVISFTASEKYAEHLSAGKFTDLVLSFFMNTFHQDEEFISNALNAANFSEYLESSIDEFFTNICTNFNINECDILLFGISSFYCFIEENFTGPIKQSTDDSMLKCLLRLKPVDSPNVLREVKANIIAHLSSNDNSISCCTHEPILLLLSKLVFRWCPNSVTKDWWMLRSLYIHQLLLPDPSPSIHEKLITLMAKLDQEVPVFHDSKLNALFLLEKIQIHLQLYSEISKAQSFMDILLKDLQLQANLIGKLGRRTKFQERDIAQLTLNVNSGGKLSERSLNYFCACFPKDQKLDDEVRLPNIQFTEECQNDSLDEIQQAAVLAIFVLTKKSKPKDKLQFEELSPYLNYLLSDPKVWSFHLTTLLFRSLLEAESSRTVERSITQIQSLITDLESLDPQPVQRLPFVFCSFMSPKWVLDGHLAKLLVEVGAIQSALDIYQHLQMWEEIVACYNYLKLRHKAAEVIRQEMAKQETVQLWCLLGDATDDETCYQKAWELSNCKSSKAQKHWALYYFTRKQYKESIPHLQKSLELNCLQISLWFNLGFACLIHENWESSASAFRRYCSLEPDSFEAWNNLAKAYIKLGQKDRAWRALQEAVKCNYDNWKVWDNLMAVSTDCADFHEVIRCYHRILDLKGKHTDTEVLRILVNALSNNSMQGDMIALTKQAVKLFGRLTSMVLNNSEIWTLYASVTQLSEEESDEKLQKIAQYYQKAQRIKASETNWEAFVDQCKDMIKLCLNLAEAQKQCSKCLPDLQATQHLNSAKLVLKSVAAKIKKSQTDVFGEMNKDLLNEMQNLKNEIDTIDNLLRKYVNT
ncbi:hypothetical protein V9T40_008553 [Parthenolecanium corni]|uniref:Tetratricopeptide repeat protein 27 n=1 Tax=Parthenolecanium corni TaxID=536013 RepID=A0AAN9Y7Z7_9HEMI